MGASLVGKEAEALTSLWVKTARGSIPLWRGAQTYDQLFFYLSNDVPSNVR